MQHHRAHLNYIVVPMSLLIVLAANDLEYQHRPFFAFNSQNSKWKICFGFPLYQQFPTYDDYNISVSVITQYPDVSWASIRWGIILKRFQNEEEISLKTRLHLSPLPSSLMETLEGQISDYRNNRLHSQK